MERGRQPIQRRVVELLNTRLKEALRNIGYIKLVEYQREHVVAIENAFQLFCEDESIFEELFEETKREVITEQNVDKEETQLNDLLQAKMRTLLRDVLDRNNENIERAIEFMNDVVQKFIQKYNSKLAMFRKILNNSIVEEPIYLRFQMMTLQQLLEEYDNLRKPGNWTFQQRHRLQIEEACAKEFATTLHDSQKSLKVKDEIEEFIKRKHEECDKTLQDVSKQAENPKRELFEIFKKFQANSLKELGNDVVPQCNHQHELAAVTLKQQLFEAYHEHVSKAEVLTAKPTTDYFDGMLIFLVIPFIWSIGLFLLVKESPENRVDLLPGTLEPKAINLNQLSSKIENVVHVFQQQHNSQKDEIKNLRLGLEKVKTLQLVVEKLQDTSEMKNVKLNLNQLSSKMENAFQVINQQHNSHTNEINSLKEISEDVGNLRLVVEKLMDESEVKVIKLEVNQLFSKVESTFEVLNREHNSQRKEIESLQRIYENMENLRLIVEKLKESSGLEVVKHEVNQLSSEVKNTFEIFNQQHKSHVDEIKRLKWNSEDLGSIRLAVQKLKDASELKVDKYEVNQLSSKVEKSFQVLNQQQNSHTNEIKSLKQISKHLENLKMARTEDASEIEVLKLKVKYLYSTADETVNFFKNEFKTLKLNILLLIFQQQYLKNLKEKIDADILNMEDRFIAPS